MTISMNFYKPFLEEQEKYNQYYRECLHLGAESSFVALYGYEENSDIQRAFEHNLYWNKGIIDGKFMYLPPLGEWQRDDWHNVLTDLFPEGITFSCVSEVLLKIWKNILGNKIEATEDRNSWDYVCRIDKLISLEGSKNKSLRQSIKKFEENNDFEYLRITPEDIPALAEFQKYWYNLNIELGKADESLKLEHESMIRIFDNWNKLDCLLGGFLRIDGKIQAYTVAEELDTYMISSTALKGNYEYKGIYQAMDYHFTKDALNDYTFLNLWNDGGYEGLRQTKLKLNPTYLIKKFDVVWKP